MCDIQKSFHTLKFNDTDGAARHTWQEVSDDRGVNLSTAVQTASAAAWI